MLCLVWIGSALLIGFLLWFFTLTYRTRLLIDVVNKTLAVGGGGQVERISGFSFRRPAVMGGTWFELHNSTDMAFVFSMIRNGIAAACVAIVDDSGKVRSILPLSDNARQITDELRLPIYRFYIDRIERDGRIKNINKGVLQ